MGGKCITANNTNDSKRLPPTWMMAGLLFYFLSAVFGKKVGCFQSELCLICHWADPEPAPKPSPSLPARRRRRGGKEPLKLGNVILALISDTPRWIRMRRDSVWNVSVSPLHVSATALIHPPAQNYHSHLQKREKWRHQRRSIFTKNPQLKRDAVTRDLAWVSFNAPVAHAGGRPHGCWQNKTQNSMSHTEWRVNSFSWGWALISWKFQVSSFSDVVKSAQILLGM